MSHIRCNRDGIKIHITEKCACIHGRSITDIAPLGIGNDKLVGITGADVIHRSFQCVPAFQSDTFIKCQIEFVSHTEIGSCVNYLLIELKNRVVRYIEKMFENFIDIGIQTNAKKCFFVKNIFNKLLFVHSVNH